jgi:hypothetical protein
MAVIAIPVVLAIRTMATELPAPQALMRAIDHGVGVARPTALGCHGVDWGGGLGRRYRDGTNK